MLENLVINLLEYRYPRNSDKFRSYFDESKNRYRHFSELIKVLRDNKDDFNDGYSTVQRFVTKLENLTKITNPTAHSLTYNATEIDVNSLELQEMLELFKKISDMVALTGIFKN